MVWLTPQQEQAAPGLGLILRVDHDLLKDPRTDVMFTLAIRRDALQQVLPSGYVMNPSQGFKPDEAARLATAIGIRGAKLTVLVGQSLRQATQTIQDTLTELEIMEWTVSAVADTELMAAIATRMAAGNPLDIVIGGKSLGKELANAYPNSFDGKFIRF